MASRRRAVLALAVLAGSAVVAGAERAEAYVCAPVQITDSIASGSQQPAISDDGETVVFTSDNSLDPSADNSDGNRELFRYRRGEGFTQLTDDTIGSVTELSIDADGDRIAFLSSENLVPAGNNDHGAELFLYDEGTDTITQATSTSSTSASGPRINDAGTDVVFASTRNLVPGTGNADLNHEAFLYTVGSGLSQLTVTTGAGVNEPVIGSDLVAFWSTLDLVPGVGNTDGSAEIFLDDLDTAGFVQATDSATDGTFSPIVSGDDSVVGFPSQADLVPGVGNTDGNSDIFSYTVAGGTLHQHTVTTGNGLGTMSVDGDGDRLAFTGDQDLDPSVGNADGSTETFVVDTTDGEISQLTDYTGSGNTDYPMLSGSGTRTVLSTTADLAGDNPDGSYEIVLADCGANGPTFSDVGVGATFAEQIEWMAAADVAQGFNDGTFRPLDGVQRSNMANFLYNLAGRPAFTPPGSPTFSDYPASKPYYVPVEWMAAEGIASGFNDGTFRPTDLVKRSNMANFLYNLAGQPAFTPPGSPTFTDYPAGSPYSTAVEWMAAEGIANGFNDGTFRPTEPVKRQQMANFLFNLTAGPGVDLS